MENQTTAPEGETEKVETTEKIEIEEKKNTKEEVIKQVRALLASKKTLALLVIVLLGGTIFYFKDYFVVAVVDGEPISRLSIIERLEKRSGKAMLDSAITEKLIDNETKRQGISVGEDDINAEIQTIEANVVAQGTTLEEALTQQGMTMEDFRQSITLQEKLEKLLDDKIKVSDEEISTYLEKNKDQLPPSQDQGKLREQVAEQLKGQKLNQEGPAYIEELRTKAKIQFFRKY
jgi:foldase protein PrsA